MKSKTGFAATALLSTGALGFLLGQIAGHPKTPELPSRIDQLRTLAEDLDAKVASDGFTTILLLDESGRLSDLQQTILVTESQTSAMVFVGESLDLELNAIHTGSSTRYNESNGGGFAPSD